MQQPRRSKRARKDQGARAAVETIPISEPDTLTSIAASSDASNEKKETPATTKREETRSCIIKQEEHVRGSAKDEAKYGVSSAVETPVGLRSTADEEKKAHQGRGW